jgi:hypothetical protein
MNQQALNHLKRQLAQSLIKGCEKAVLVIKANTPIDTQRLYESTRVEAEDLDYSADVLEVEIVAGGVAIAGIKRETGIVRDVDYGIYVERRDGYIASTLPEIENAITSEF